MTDLDKKAIEFYKKEYPYSNSDYEIWMMHIEHEARDAVKFYEFITSNRPKIVCLCGSTRFGEAFQKANLNETLNGNIVLSIGCSMRSDAELFADLSDSALNEIKDKLDELYKRKIDLADEILVLNVGGYIGKSTSSEIEYAVRSGKKVTYLE